MDALDDEIAAWTRDQDVDALEGALQERGIPAHRVSTSADLFDDPQLAAREHFIWLEHPAHGSVPVEAARMRLCDTPPVYTHPGPMIGEHTDAVLREILGLDDDAVTELVIAGALG